MLPIKAAWRAVATSSPLATKLSYDDVRDIARLMKAGLGDKEISARFRLAPSRTRKIRQILGLQKACKWSHDPDRNARLEAAARAWAEGTESQRVVAERYGVLLGSMSGVVKRLGLAKKGARVVPGPKPGSEQLVRDENWVKRQAELDKAMRERTERIIAALDRRRELAGGPAWKDRWGDERSAGA